ncbi:MAG: MarR family transcriptional regulator [Candidatus Methylophosphatis roskildensis]|uniref:MarR family transcriptional regulator n=1 Tax=Candidatus Methylophosphatis roskildensis TaxID=2899263 RepID=A0A9D7HSN7_9PROT|nr:MarR family transcriptional regulator [Candidatus Methylophosphatis roskildensis]MBK6974801.1 MarR family transcriptional regulator [Candidatus Methylophosphatis roskildensis]MBK7235986.1 MarR family transcriptional regulator [Sterolibacteriaceae bacterium]
MAVLQRFRVLIRAAQRHSQWIERQSGITGAQLWALQELVESPGLRVGELAQRMALHQSTASNLLERLETAGLVRRNRSDSDQRVVLVFSTDQGSALLAAAPSPARGILPEALRNLDAASLARLARELDHLFSNVRSLDKEFGKQPLPFTE